MEAWLYGPWRSVRRGPRMGPAGGAPSSSGISFKTLQWGEQRISGFRRMAGRGGVWSMAYGEPEENNGECVGPQMKLGSGVVRGCPVNGWLGRDAHSVADPVV